MFSKFMTVLSAVTIFSTICSAKEMSLSLKRGDYLPFISALRNDQAKEPEAFAIFCMVEDEAVKQFVQAQNPYVSLFNLMGIKTEHKIGANFIDMTTPGEIKIRMEPGEDHILKITCSN